MALAVDPSAPTSENSPMAHSYSYGAFGEGGRVDGAGFAGRWGGFSATPGVLNWNRWYKPTGSTWIARDPIGIQGGTNQYLYVSNSPLNSYDQSGLCKTPDDCYDDYIRAIIRAFLPSPRDEAQLMADSAGTLGANTRASIGGGLRYANRSSSFRAAARWEGIMKLTSKLMRAANSAITAWSLFKAIEDYKNCMKNAAWVG